jgi:predicted DNA-binding transcriptional regulator AlpA
MSRERLLRLKQILGDPRAKPPIEGIVPVSRATWYRCVQNGFFPKSISISPRCVAWKASDIEKLLKSWEKHPTGLDVSKSPRRQRKHIPG